MTNIITSTVDQTISLAENIGKQLKGGEVIELSSDLGGGKTTFTRGLAGAINSKDVVASPTFTIRKLYKGERLNIHHFDLYRIDDLGLLEHDIQDVLSDPKNVLVIEWGGLAADILPQKRLKIYIKHHANEDTRIFDIQTPAGLDYLVKNVKNV